jgi:hypothetical protein
LCKLSICNPVVQTVNNPVVETVNETFNKMSELMYIALHLINIQIQRHDKKMDRLLTGIGDGCDLCTAPREVWNISEVIEDDLFEVDRSIAGLKDLHRK